MPLLEVKNLKKIYTTRFGGNQVLSLIHILDVRRIPKKELMDTVAFVFQDSRLLKASVLDNVRLGKPDASREEVLGALKAAQCEDLSLIHICHPDGIIDCLFHQFHGASSLFRAFFTLLLTNLLF